MVRHLELDVETVVRLFQTIAYYLIYNLNINAFMVDFKIKVEGY